MYIWFSQKLFISLAALVLLIKCDDTPAESLAYELTPEGIGAIQLGDYLRKVDSLSLPRLEVTEDQQFEGAYTWMTRTITWKNGDKVILEGDFFETDKVNDQLLQLSKVNRIRIESPDFTTSEGIHTGSTFKQLSAVFPDSSMMITPFPAYNMIEVFIPGYSPFHYLFSTENYSEEQIRSASISPEDRISTIVIM